MTFCLSPIILSPLNGTVKMSPYEQGDSPLSQKELQRVAVISLRQGQLACARAAELLDLSPRHINRLKARYRQGSAAALAHASRGRPSPRRLPERVRARILHLARTRYAGFNDHHLCEKLSEVEGLSLEPRDPSPPAAHRGHRLAPQASCPLSSPAPSRPRSRRRAAAARRPPPLGSKIAAPSSPLSACRTTPPAKSWPPNFSPPKLPLAISACSAACCAASAFPSLLRRSSAASSFATTSTGPSKNNSPANASQPSSAAPSSNSASPTSPRKARRPRAASNDSGAPFRIVSPANCVWPALLRSPRRQRRPPPLPPRLQPALRPRAARSAKAWRPAPKNLDRICCFLHERAVSNDNVVQWDGHRLQIHPQPRRFSFAGAKVQLHHALDGRIALYYGDTRLQFTTRG